MFEISSVKEGWSDGTLSPVSVFYIAVRNDRLVFNPRSGRCPTGEEFISASLRLMKAYEAAEGSIERPRRESPIRFLVELDEDSETVYLEEEVDRGYPVKREIVSTLWGGKVEIGSNTSIYDLLDLLVADGRIAIETAISGQQYYRFLEGDDGFDSMTIIPPRDTAHEKGWALPAESPRLVVNGEE